MPTVGLATGLGGPCGPIFVVVGDSLRTGGIVVDIVNVVDKKFGELKRGKLAAWKIEATEIGSWEKVQSVKYAGRKERSRKKGVRNKTCKNARAWPVTAGLAFLPNKQK